jgi:23S rRNA (adenine2503-C2)-methyltransferase
VETVLIPQLEKTDPDADADDVDEASAGPTWVPGTVVTQCISSQVGCAMGCVFCASGVMGLKRHMTAAEIVSQVLLGRSLTTEREHLRNIVLMGMGRAAAQLRQRGPRAGVAHAPGRPGSRKAPA